MTYYGIRQHVQMLDRAKLETYLTVDEFERVFGMTQEEFAQIPKWKQITAKKEKVLF